MAPPISAGEITLDRNPNHYAGDPITITGTNTLSNTTYLKIEKVGSGGDDPEYAVVTVDGTGRWEYTLKKHVDQGAKYIFAWNSSDMTPNTEDYYGVFTVHHESDSPNYDPGPLVYAPTRTPVPDYGEKIAELEKRIAEQETVIAAARATPDPITPPTPIPTATIDHAATIAALEKSLEEMERKQNEQGDWIQQILKFLGLA